MGQAQPKGNDGFSHSHVDEGLEDELEHAPLGAAQVRRTSIATGLAYERAYSPYGRKYIKTKKIRRF